MTKIFPQEGVYDVSVEDQTTTVTLDEDEEPMDYLWIIALLALGLIVVIVLFYRKRNEADPGSKEK